MSKHIEILQFIRTAGRHNTGLVKEDILINKYSRKLLSELVSANLIKDRIYGNMTSGYHTHYYLTELGKKFIRKEIE